MACVRGLTTDLRPDSLVEVLVQTAVGAGHHQRQAEQRRPVLLRRQEVDVHAHLVQHNRSFAIIHPTNKQLN